MLSPRKHDGLWQGTPTGRVEEGRTAWAPDVDVLNRIGEPAMDLVIWERRLPPDLQTWLVSLRVDQLPCGRMLVGRTDIRDALDALFASSGTPDGPPANALLHDIVDVAERFAAVAECDPIDIRLDVVDHDACWKFHRDNVDLRLLTTYVGPGTQYVTPGNAERAIDRQKAYDGPIEHVPEQAVALFDVIETLDRPKLARELRKAMDKLGRTPRLYVQVNTGEEEQKAGVLPQDLAAFLAQIRNDQDFVIEGLMCIPPVEEPAGPHFALLADLAAANGVEKLSMGMSGDYETAIRFGATSVRVGSAFFGDRPSA